MIQSSPPFALVVRFVLRPGVGREFDALTERTVAQIKAAEPGTLVYACHRVDGADDQRIFYELYRDRTAFEVHEQQEHVRHFLAAREALVERFEVDFLSGLAGKVPAVRQEDDRSE